MFFVEFNFKCIRKIVKSGCYLRHIRLSVCLSVCPSTWNTSATTGLILMKMTFA